MLRITGGLAFHRYPLPLPFAWTTVATGVRLCDFLLTELSGFVDIKETWITLCSDAFGAHMPRPKPCTRRLPSPPWPCMAVPTTSPTPTCQDPRRPAATRWRRASLEDPITEFTPLRSIHTSPSISPPGICLRCPRSTGSATASAYRTLTPRLQNCVVQGERAHRACARVTQHSLEVTHLGRRVCLEIMGDRPCHLLSRSAGIAKGRVTVQVRSSKRFLLCSYAFSRKGIVNLIKKNNYLDF